MTDLVLLGFDFGSKRIGVAIGQTISHSASPLQILPANNGIPDWTIIEKLINEWCVNALVVGIPYYVDGKESDMTKAAKKFAEHLRQKFSLPVYEIDEVLTSDMAEHVLKQSGQWKRGQKNRIDDVAAQIILESWLSQYYK